MMMKQAHRGLRRKLAETTYLIDATSVRLNGFSADWARFSAKVCGAKVHVIYDADADRPIYAAVSAANVNDITAAHQMPIEPGATYVFDLGYYDYGWWAKLDTAGCRIVTRFKANTPLDLVEELPLAAGWQHPLRPHRLSARPPGQEPPQSDAGAVREVRVITETGKVLRILSNDLDASAQEIADLYQAPLGHRVVLPLGQADPRRSPASSAPPRTPSASRSPSPSLPSSCCGWLRPPQTAFKARSPSHGSFAPTSCIARRIDQPARSSNPTPVRINARSIRVPMDMKPTGQPWA